VFFSVNQNFLQLWSVDQAIGQKIIKINHLLISDAPITQEWQLIVNAAVTENQRCLQQKLTIDILQIFFTHYHNLETVFP